MSDYQKVKARAQALQREKEEAVRREAAIKAERDKQQAKEEEERQHRREEQAKEARRIELIKANQALAEKAELDRRLREGKAPVTPLDGGEEYDPFAEDVRKPRPVQNQNGGTTKATSKTKAKPAEGATSTSHTSSSKPRTSTSKVSSTGTSTKDRSSPPPLGRKEKAARLFAQQAIKSSRGESLFSIRDLVEGRESPGTARPRPSHVKVEKSWSLTTRQRVNKDMHKEGLRKLCTDRDTRDRRTIDEIQRDARARKEAKLGNDKEKEKKKIDSTPLPKVRPKLPPIPTTARPAPTSHSPALPPPAQRTVSPKRRRRSSSPSSSSSYETDERPSKRGTFERSLPSHAAISAEIQALFRRPDRPAPKRMDWSDDDSDDMEAGLSDVEAEERRTAKIARLEDEAAEREERMRREDKERRKRERDKPKSKA
ncbi:hypothetical protein BCR39DRAFT_556833 [Naematelia encephala]|uniref:SPT2 chromatin protein-domain-containing protein n=1 Tax=Naematelia encephala TaxID=71784 RepID=A0A1Y2BGV9_9TREE|nr:hypothetical protein BCR39DRAFT_556833 [Naematelia encephala]